MELCQDGFGDSSSSATLTNESKCQHGGRGGAVEAESSPTDRVERLLRKYRVRKKNRTSMEYTQTQVDVDASSSSSLLLQSSCRLSKQVMVELELWAAVNDNLQSRSYKGVEFERNPNSLDVNPSEFLLLSVPASTAARLSVASLIQELRLKDDMIKDLRTKVAQLTVSAPAPNPPPQAVVDRRVISELESQVARLENENAKLKSDLQNNGSCLQELSSCQKRLKEVELELLQKKPGPEEPSSQKQELELLQKKPSLEEPSSQVELELLQKKLSQASRQSESKQCEQQIKEICSELSVSSGGDILPQLRRMRATLDGHTRLEQHFSSLVELVYHHSNPKLVGQWERPVVPHPSGHDLWCEVTWSHMTMTLQDWSYHLQGLKELEGVVWKACQQLEQSTSPRHSNRQGPAEEEDEDPPLRYTCHDMASLLRRWLRKKSGTTSVSLQMVLAMVQHFQKLFDLHSLDAVFPTMTMLSQQVEQYRNIKKQLKSILNLDADCSTHKLVSAIELMVLKDNSYVMEKINRHLGPKMDCNRVIEKLRLCDEFFPAFYSLVQEIQLFLGVNSLSAIIPALHQLRAT